MLSDGRFWAGVAAAVAGYFVWRYWRQRQGKSA